ncbi:centrosomal protein of 89 kDa [Trichomycterus rosablanca]|uniref:centrosomal protein of 89 kDa n=1 Tax=Trichomycterus rosablanca TaxID=2290929 RepID=UPI002F356409
MSKFNFSFRRKERRAFKHIAHGLIPAATIAPRPAVPRTPPPRSPNPSPERPRSALAAAILTSSLTGRTFAIPPPRNRSYSESDCSHTDSQAGFEPFASTALYTRDQWPDSMPDRPRFPSLQPDDDEFDRDEDDEEEIEEDVEIDDGHVYQSLDRQGRAAVPDAVYAAPLKKVSSRSKLDDDTDNSTFEIVSPLNTEDETELEEGTAMKKPTLALQARNPSHRSMLSPDLMEYHTDHPPKCPSSSTPKRKPSVNNRSPSQGSERNKSGESEASSCAVELHQGLIKELRELKEQNSTLCAEKEAMERRCSEQSRQIQHLQQQLTHSQQHKNQNSELLSLRQQAQELVDQNDGLKMTVHRLNVELSRYQATFRPLTRDEHCRSIGLSRKGPAPAWLLDMKYLSPLLLAYEDQLAESNQLLKSCEEEVRILRARVEEVIQENDKLHSELSKRSSVSNKEWRQLQDQARLVLEENQVLIEQLELQHTKTKETHTKHTQEVCKVSKQVILLEAEKQSLETELESARKELHVLKIEIQKAHSALESSVSCVEHSSATDNLKRQLEEKKRTKSSELEALHDHVSTLQAEKKTLLREKNDLNTDIQHLENELQLARQANRKAQKRIDRLKQQTEESLQKELLAYQYLASIVMLAEKTTYERDQLIQMASCLEKDKQGVLSRILDGTVRLGKLQEKVKVYKHQASRSVCALSQRLRDQEQDFAGKAASFQREIRHLQAQLRDRQEQLSDALQQRREVENELEVVWEASATENQHLQNMVLGKVDVLLSAPDSRPSLAWKPRDDIYQASTMIQKQDSLLCGSNSEQKQNLSSDESEKNGLDFYS